MPIRVGIGQDSHRFVETGDRQKPLILGGIEISSELELEGNSDADVVLHALCNAISSVSGKIIMGPYTDKLCEEQKITSSAVYVVETMKTLSGYTITSVSIAIECLTPKIVPHIEDMRKRISEILNITVDSIGITATSGENLTTFGQGKGIQAFVVIAAIRNDINEMLKCK